GLSREAVSVTDDVYNIESNKNGNANGIRKIVEEIVDQYAKNITNQGDLIEVISSNRRTTCNIGRVLNITSDITLPERLILKFTNEGMLRIRSGVTVTLNAQ